MDPEEQLRYKNPFADRSALRNVVILVTLVLVALPIWNSFQDLLTRLVIRAGWYEFIAQTIVPYELSIVGMILHLLHIPIQVGNTFIEFTGPDKSHEAIYLIWNCVGWQSAVLLIITLITGLSGRHSLRSKLEVGLLGILGTYLVNLLRLVLVILVYYYTGRLVGTIFHDYISNLLTLFWLFWFWKYAYETVLEVKS